MITNEDPLLGCFSTRISVSLSHYTFLKKADGQQEQFLMGFPPTQAALEAQQLERQRVSRGREVAFSNLAHRAHVARMFRS